jgi:cell wall-associated NlpC family hydrolase
VPTTPTDGRLPALGQRDAYLDAAQARDRALALLSSARRDLAATDRVIEARSAEARSAALDAAIARQGAVAARDDVDDLVRELYQNGDASMQSLAFVLTSGPDAFLQQLQGIADVRAAAAQTVEAAASSDAAGRDAEARERTALDALDAALAVRDRQDDAVHRAYRGLRAATALLAELGAARPQTTVGPQGCPGAAPPGALREGADAVGIERLCRSALEAAATPQAALAITWALQHLGAAYACGGAGRMLPFRADCSSFVSRAYAEGAGLRTAGDGWAPSTRDMVPWDGVALDPHYAYVAPAALRPGDLVLYDTCPQGGCPYKHVVMYLGAVGGQEWMAHTDSCGDVAKVERFWGLPASGGAVFLVARRVAALPGEQVRVP